jgi:hypothetical protein
MGILTDLPAKNSDGFRLMAGTGPQTLKLHSQNQGDPFKRYAPIFLRCDPA